MTPDNRPIDLTALRLRLADHLTEALHDRGGLGDLTLLKAPKPIPDAVEQILVRDKRGRPAGVLMQSARGDADHDLVGRGLDCARGARALLGPDLGEVIVEPLFELHLDGRTYALFPHCPPLSERRLIWPIQRRLVSGTVLSWLRGVARVTSRPASDSQLRELFIEPLRALTDDRRFSHPVREAAADSIVRLEDGNHHPRLVVAHNDLWKGNILLPPRSNGASPRRYRFVVVDWPGARTDGHAIYDLVRIADSLHLSRRRLADELRAYRCELDCQLQDAPGYLLASLAVLGDNLGYFDPKRYVAMAERCFVRLQEALVD